MKLKHILLFLLLTSCTTSELEELSHYYNTRAQEEVCEEITAGNGIYIDSCKYKVGGIVYEDINFILKPGVRYRIDAGEGSNNSYLEVGDKTITLVSQNDVGDATLVEMSPGNIHLAAHNNTNVYVQTSGVKIQLGSGQNLEILGLKTSASGLSSGKVYRTGNTLNIVP